MKKCDNRAVQWFPINAPGTSSPLKYSTNAVVYMCIYFYSMQPKIASCMQFKKI